MKLSSYIKAHKIKSTVCGLFALMVILASIPDNHAGGVGVVGIVALIALYWLPTIVAKRGKSPNTAIVAIINTLFGWSGLGWIVALVMASRKPATPTVPIMIMLPVERTDAK
jgi:hypothetical protein